MAQLLLSLHTCHATLHSERLLFHHTSYGTPTHVQLPADYNALSLIILCMLHSIAWNAINNEVVAAPGSWGDVNSDLAHPVSRSEFNSDLAHPVSRSEFNSDLARPVSRSECNSDLAHPASRSEFVPGG